jgi:NADPH-dependent ferric siderophore reductase
MTLQICGLTDPASAAATAQPAHYPTFLRPDAPASCMRWLGGRVCEARQYRLYFSSKARGQKSWLDFVSYWRK